jgi:hypothetical protein
MSIPGRNLTAAMLLRAGFVVVLVRINDSGFRPLVALIDGRAASPRMSYAAWIG